MEIVAPTGQRTELGGVIARACLLIALEHFGDVHYVADIDTGQRLHQVFEGRRLWA